MGTVGLGGLAGRLGRAEGVFNLKTEGSVRGGTAMGGGVGGRGRLMLLRSMMASFSGSRGNWGKFLKALNGPKVVSSLLPDLGFSSLICCCFCSSSLR